MFTHSGWVGGIVANVITESIKDIRCLCDVSEIVWYTVAPEKMDKVGGLCLYRHYGIEYLVEAFLQSNLWKLGHSCRLVPSAPA